MSILNRPVHNAENNLAEGLSGTASGSTFSKVAGGVGAAIVVGVIGLRALPVTRSCREGQERILNCLDQLH